MEPTTLRGGEILGIRIATIGAENRATRCAFDGAPIEGVPFRVSILDVVSTETPHSWAEEVPLNPGPHQFHPDPAHVRGWMARQGYLWCRLSEVREIMRPIAIPGEPPRWGLCDGLHREDHEFVPA